MNKILSLLILLVVINVNAMDQIVQKQQERTQKAAELSKKIYLGRWKNLSKDDVTLNFGKSITLNANDVNEVFVDELVELGKIEEKGYFCVFNVTKLLYNKFHDTELTIILSLVLSDTYRFTTIAKVGRNKPHTSKIDLSTTEVPEGIFIDGEIDGDDLAASRIFCKPRTNNL